MFLTKFEEIYRIIWVVGTMFGVTQNKVDMQKTRANAYGQFSIAVLDPQNIPTKMYVMIGNCHFKVKFEVEPFPPNSGIFRQPENDNVDQDDDMEDVKNDEAINGLDVNMTQLELKFIYQWNF